MQKNTFQNPLLSGFYPDPSICRVNDDYYMVTSSFVYFPGLPIFHSKDLVHWEQIGYAISRSEQLNYKNCETSLGLWAPTIRYHDGTFYIINTFVSEGREARRDNFILTATNPAGPWSNAHFIENADGIDSSLFFDSDNRIWYAGNFIFSPGHYEGHHGIYLCELSPTTFQFKGERKVIWDGEKTHSKWIEAPHIYYKDGWYYLMVAEGGTFTNHSVMMARSKNIDGEYSICPRNPIVTHRHLSLEYEISVTGHADLVETQNGEWWMVLLAVRPYSGAHFNLGRETFMIPIVWETDGWPRVDNENGLVNRTERLPALPPYTAAPAFYSDNFESEHLGMQWNSIHPYPADLFSLTACPGCLRLYLRPEVLNEICTPAFLGRRQQHQCFRLKAAMDFSPSTDFEEAGLALIQDDRYHYTFTLCARNGEKFLQVRKCENHTITVLAETDPVTDGRIYLTISTDASGYHFYYGKDEQNLLVVYLHAAPELLSSLTNEGFTGTYLGLYATSNQTDSTNYADYDWVIYEGLS